MENKNSKIYHDIKKIHDTQKKELNKIHALKDWINHFKYLKQEKKKWIGENKDIHQWLKEYDFIINILQDELELEMEIEQKKQELDLVNFHEEVYQLIEKHNLFCENNLMIGIDKVVYSLKHENQGKCVLCPMLTNLFKRDVNNNKVWLCKRHTDPEFYYYLSRVKEE